jgi:Ala-tRNA(Pro) deacylase
MPASRRDLFELLERLAIATTTREHPAVFTVAESEALERSIPGGHTKNLFLIDAKGAVVLVVAESDTRVDLKSLSRRLGTARFSFGKADRMMELLGVTPGSVTAFAVMNDVEGRVRVVVDERLMRHELVNGHPLENTATTTIRRDDLLRFLVATGHPPEVVALTGTDEAGA